MTAIPGPRGHYLHGNQLEFNVDPQRFLRDSARQYGGFVRFRLGLKECFLISDLKEIQRILTEREAFTDKRPSPRMAAAYPRSVARLEGEAHTDRRRLLEPAFRPARSLPGAELVDAETQAELEGWIDGELRPLFPSLTRLALRCLVLLLIGEAGRESLPGLEVAMTVAEAWMGGSPVVSEAQFRAADAILRRSIARAVAARREAGPVDPPDLLQALIQGVDSGRIDEASLVDELVMMWITRVPIAVALSWTFYHLAADPGARARLEAELEAGGDTPAEGSAGARSEGGSPGQPWLDAVLREALRLHPPVWTLARETRTDYESRGHPLRPDQEVLLSPFAVQRLPELWERPDEFLPERFIPGSPLYGDRPRLAWFPFGAGLRKCIGERLTMMMMQRIVATVARSFHLELVDGYTPADPGQEALRPRNGLPVRVRRRIG